MESHQRIKDKKQLRIGQRVLAARTMEGKFMPEPEESEIGFIDTHNGELVISTEDGGSWVELPDGEPILVLVATK